mmetsp:Transcript_83223/g.269406  ORF Transcript_83223/g.269406 Transcript_83223/m.269406 type:complete len:227 (+) Transcript_83223:483-1163(+)
MVNEDDVAGVALGLDVDEAIHPIFDTFEHRQRLMRQPRIRPPVGQPVVPHHRGARHRLHLEAQLREVRLSSGVGLEAREVHEDRGWPHGAVVVELEELPGLVPQRHERLHMLQRAATDGGHPGGDALHNIRLVEGEMNARGGPCLPDGLCAVALFVAGAQQLARLAHGHRGALPAAFAELQDVLNLLRRDEVCVVHHARILDHQGRLDFRRAGHVRTRDGAFLTRT